MTTKKNLIHLPVWIRALPKFDNDFPANVGKKLNVTYAHLTQILYNYKEKGWVHTEKQGRKVYCTLTAEGKAVSDVCCELIRKVEEKKL